MLIPRISFVHYISIRFLCITLFSSMHLSTLVASEVMDILTADNFDPDDLIPVEMPPLTLVPFAPKICIIPTIQLPPEVIVGKLTTPPVQLQNVLQHDLYHVTYPLNTRSLHTIPTLSTIIQAWPIDCKALGVKPFFSYTRRMNFTSCSTKILSYLTMLTSDDFIEILDQNEFNTINIPEVLPLFGNVTIEQRELGGMFFAQWMHHHTLCTLSLPCYYLENNYFLSSQDRERIEDSMLFAGTDTPIPSQDFATFTEDHFINDRAGIGDLRLELLHLWHETTCGSHMTAGIQVTAPTGHILFNGIIATCPKAFCRTNPAPYFDFQMLANLYTTSLIPGNESSKVQLAELIVDYSITALDRLSSLVLNNGLGEQHWTIGPIWRMSGVIRDDLTLLCCGEISYYIPGKEIRLFKVAKESAEFNRNYADATQAQQNLNFLSQEATDTLYPTGVKITVKPGVAIDLNLSLLFKGPSYTASLGYDFWAKTKETFGSVTCRYPICDPCADQYTMPRYIPGRPLDYVAGQRPSAIQGKIFGTITSSIPGVHSHDARIGLRGDVTVNRHGLGRDFTAAIDIIVDF